MKKINLDNNVNLKIVFEDGKELNIRKDIHQNCIIVNTGSHWLSIAPNSSNSFNLKLN